MFLRMVPIVVVVSAASLFTGACSLRGDDSRSPIVIDFGPRGDEDDRRARTRRVGDRVGEPFRRWVSLISGREPLDLFTSGVVAISKYRLDLAPGEWIVAVGFCEPHHDLPGRRVFDVSAGGEPLVESLDPVAVAGRDVAFRIARRVTVRGRRGLEIRFTPRVGEALVNVIQAWPYEPRESPPPAPRLAGSYRSVVLDWRHVEGAHVAGYVVERRAAGAGGSFRPITESPTPISRLIDRDVEPGRPHEYRAATVDVDGRRGPFGDVVRVTPRSLEESSLPLYRIELPEESLRFMLSDPLEDRTVRGMFTLEEREYPIDLRIRGASTRHLAKKSYRLRFVEESPLSRRVTYLKAGAQDATLQREKLTCDVFAAIGLPVSSARFVNLVINGRYRGVYTDIEPIRSPFKASAGLDPDGTLLRAASFQHLHADRPAGELRGDAGSVEELSEFIRRLNRVDRGELAEFLRGATDWPRVRDYLVASVLCHRSEIEADDSFYYRDRESGRWIRIPWDHNNGNFGLLGPVRQPVEPFMPVLGQTLQGIGHRHEYWYVLPSRAFNDPGLLHDYLDRLEEQTRALLLSGAVDRMIDANFEALRAEGPIDPSRWPPGRLEPFTRSPRHLKRFVARHARRLLELIAEARRPRRSPLVINEFRFGPLRGWVELHNRGDRDVELDGWALGDIEQRGAPWRLPDERLAAGAYRVFRLRFDPIRPRRRSDQDRELDAEARERREIEERRRRRSHFAGFDPAGGTIGLFAPRGRRRDDRDADDARLVDWYFYGRQDDRLSYGRRGGALDDRAATFGFMEPTPGRENATETLRPPPLLADGGVARQPDGSLRITARITTLCPGPPPASMVVRHRSGDGAWRETEMDLAGDGGTASAVIPASASRGSLGYYFIARGENGLERRGPMTGPGGWYRSPE